MSEYRVCHDSEYQDVWRSNVPEVYNLGGILGATNLTCAWQWFIMRLNPGITKRGFRSLLSWDRAFTNGTGFDDPKRPPRADYVNDRDTSAKLPRFDKVRVCGGAILHGKQIGEYLLVETLAGNKPPPDLEWVKARPWLYFRAVVVLPDGNVGDFPQNGGNPVYIPLVSTAPVIVRLNHAVIGKPIPYIVECHDR